DWATVAHTALEKLSGDKITPPDSWLLAYGRAYLRANGQPVDDSAKTLKDLLDKLPVTGTNLTTPFTDKLVYLDGTDRKTYETAVKTRAEVENGVWRLAFNNPGSVIETKDGWFGFAAANILDDDTFANQWVKKIKDEVVARIHIDLGDQTTIKALG